MELFDLLINQRAFSINQNSTALLAYVNYYSNWIFSPPRYYLVKDHNHIFQVNCNGTQIQRQLDLMIRESVHKLSHKLKESNKQRRKTVLHGGDGEVR